MARKRSKKSGKAVLIAVVLVILIAIVIGAVRYIGTPAGEALLLDMGFGGKYTGVQRGLDGRIVQALLLAGVERKSVVIETKKIPGEKGRIAVVTVSAPQEISLIEVNSFITEAVAEGGGRVRSCSESAGGRIIEMEIGTRRHTTHTCIVKKRKVRKPAIDTEQPRLAIVVDDFGYFYNQLVREFLSLEIPITVTVIPGLKHSKKICDAAGEAGKEILCHLPMEPERGSYDGGEISLIRVEMSDKEIEKAVSGALETTPHVKGMNNHMGSRATADRRVMEAVLRVCRKRGLFFIDSMTTQRSAVREAAKKVRVATLSNDLFIDNEGEDRRENMGKIISIARRRGYAVGIVHVKRGTLDDIEWMIGESKRAGVKFVTISDMIAEQAKRR
ncbi:MAG: divergent polysaccharide deacetylase family protein [Candidatus Krumholzibacteria bacterium]|nr:divergent polysaccharide deacetylase family protein [Candidatus Krumholzibacteria bacterium]